MPHKHQAESYIKTHSQIVKKKKSKDKEKNLK